MKDLKGAKDLVLQVFMRRCMQVGGAAWNSYIFQPAPAYQVVNGGWHRGPIGDEI